MYSVCFTLTPAVSQLNRELFVSVVEEQKKKINAVDALKVYYLKSQVDSCCFMSLLTRKVSSSSSFLLCWSGITLVALHLCCYVIKSSQKVSKLNAQCTKILGKKVSMTLTL